ncbi:MAG: hypothetical protein QG657_2105 [Acidobacteriota bacterium]|nr:hypothetical protein [Acidobacteriota bacterium]
MMSEKKGLITKRIDDNQSAPPIPISANTAIHIGKTVGTPDVETETDAGEKNKQGQPHGQLLSVQEIAQWMIDFFGKEIFQHIKDNPNFQLPALDNTSFQPLEDWVVNALKTVLSYDCILAMGKNIRENIDKLEAGVQRLRQENTTLEERLSQQFTQVRQITGERDDAIFKLHQMRQQYRVGIPLKILIENFIDNETGKNNSIMELLHEALENPTENTSLFVVRWCRGWADLKPMPHREYDTEEELLSMLYDALTGFLSRVSGIFIPQRRPLLKELAKIVSRELTTYEFLSPEETRQVDPAVHVVPKTGGTTIKEGISFAVIRKTTRQTVRYAQVSTQ